MEIKKALDHYFKELISVWDKKYGTYPKAPWDEEIDPLLYLSSPDEEEYVYWKPIEKVELDDFTKIEKELGINIHYAIKEYFNSYWFLNLQGFYGSRLVNLEPVEPGKPILRFFQTMKRYEENNGREFRYIQIGFASPEDMAIIFDNETGKILIENYETEENEFLANSLSELINNLKIEWEV
ncbi:SecY-interacting protein Syd [Bacillus aquiflavi]|uniref:SecY-interacting protein Syd n=1 Tax=Bacillus aquiflavi TaxID=2672567 RepID=UPI001CA87E0B|nr:SecY-interacting protein Syd [Bacillus aquiflavi]UAC48710.1 SecY-interacting protein Syd [Bacillus aquiflavi]